MCLKLESRSPDGSVAVITLDKFAINPTPPIQDAYFKYTPSPNVTVTDGTDGMIQMFKRMTAMGR
ncbi:hypothetical protein LLG95_01425 [bacterium]|nr:hypothetical protein [bacterium]